MKCLTAAPRTAKRLLVMLALLAGFATVFFGPGASTAQAAVIVTTDAQGANDEPGQKDLTQFTIDDAAPAGTLLVSFNHDETGFTGNNTGDGCLLFDTDGDGNANYSLCTTFGGSPTALQTTRLFTCGDERIDRCTQPITEITTFSSTCSLSTGVDPFGPAATNGPGDSYPADTTSSCNVVLADVGGPGAVLIDACSYPSQEPNSDPSDCIVAGAGSTPVTFRSFTASRTAKAVTLRWKTGSEIDMLGYNVYVERNGKRVKLNRSLIAGKGLLGGSYAFKTKAPSAKKPVRYWLEALDLDGARTFRSVLAR